MKTSSTKKQKKVLVICPSPKGTAATQRFKYEQYLPLLAREGFSFTISSFQSNRLWKIIYQPGRIVEKIAWVIYGYLVRVFDLIRSPFFDIVFINLWVTPLGPPLFERLMVLFNNRIIYDLDDMIFLPDQKEFGIIPFFKGKKKSLVLMRWASIVIVCTPKLEEKALSLNRFNKVIDISSTLDTQRFTVVKNYRKNAVTTIGWTGTHSTLPFLELIQPALVEISKQRPIKLLIIANNPFTMAGVPTEFLPWREETEVEDLQRIEIGVYPIPTNEWSLGKSSLKALTYMSVGIPVVATAYGTNFRVIDDSFSGFLVRDQNEWVTRIIALIDDLELRKKIGLAGRKKVEENFSIKANFPKYLQTFNDVLKK